MVDIGKGPLKIGYLMQNGAPDLNQLSGPQLHVMAVIKDQQKLNHIVRIVSIQNNQILWSDNFQTWYQPDYEVTQRKWFSYTESAIRRVQSELKLPFLGIFDSLHFADACLNQLRGFDILYERHGYMGFGGVIAARWLGIPLVLELNGNILKEIDERKLSMSVLQREIGKWITIQTFNVANRIVVVSEALKHALIADYHIPENKISVVVNGVNLDLFSLRFDRQSTLEQFGLSDTPIVTFVGSFEPWHGVDLLISSFAEIHMNYPNLQLILVGDGSGRKKAETDVEQLGLNAKVKFLGRVSQEQVAAILSVTRIVVAPYPFEYSDIVGTPLKLLEYMASGKGIVATTAPIHEIIEDGVTGLRVLPANKKALADGIAKLLDDEALCYTLGRNAVLHAQRFSWENVSLELSKIIRKEIQLKAN
jgi:alpha-maltose-1-phosphate synthase